LRVHGPQRDVSTDGPTDGPTDGTRWVGGYVHQIAGMMYVTSHPSDDRDSAGPRSWWTPGRVLGGLTSVRRRSPLVGAGDAGRQGVGIDLHRRRSVIVRMDEPGRRPDMVRID